MNKKTKLDSISRLLDVMDELREKMSMGSKANF